MGNAENNIWEGVGKTQNNATASPKNPIMNIDFRRILYLWPFVLLFGLIGYAIGSIYLRYVTPIYTISTSIALENDDDISLMNIFVNSKSKINDKIEYFKSPTIAAQIIDSLGLQYHSESQGKFKSKDYYGIIRWELVKVGNEKPALINFSIIPNKDGFKFFSGNIVGEAKWDKPFFIKKNCIIIHNFKKITSSNPIYCYNEDKSFLAFSLSRNIVVTESKTSNAITINYSDQCSERAIDILNWLIEMQKQIIEQEKTIKYTKTVEFIDNRLDPLSKDLDSIEINLLNFKAKIGIGGENQSLAAPYISSINSSSSEIFQIEIQEATIKAVEEFINNPKLRDSDLSYVGLEKSNLPDLCKQFQSLRLQREKMSLVAQDINPAIKSLDKNIAELRSNMDNQLNNIKVNLKVLKNIYQKKDEEARAALLGVPVLEKEMIDKTRFQDIKRDLYLTMLHKREEALIARASISVNTKIIYPPLESNAIVKPSRSSILLISIVIGMLLPIIFGFIKEVSNRKIVSKKVLQSISNIPILAELEQVDTFESFPFVIGGNNRSMFGEQIRSLRTNVNFYLDPKKKTNYILLTSSVSGEGKSFLSMNVAKSYSVQGKKVALLEFDLRRPKISAALNLKEKSVGLTGLLVGKYTPEEIKINIFQDKNEQLDFFPSGPVPPNPQELISTSYMNTLKEYLDNNYDVVIVDTPPFGIVADAQILGTWADLVLMVTRFNQTTSDQILEINEWVDNGVFKSVGLIFNGVKNSGYFGYKYGYYYYKRKYGYGYYSSYISEKKESKKEKNTL